jgi:hypothetical protein
MNEMQNKKSFICKLISRYRTSEQKKTRKAKAEAETKVEAEMAFFRSRLKGRKVQSVNKWPAIHFSGWKALLENVIKISKNINKLWIEKLKINDTLRLFFVKIFGKSPLVIVFTFTMAKLW